MRKEFRYLFKKIIPPDKFSQIILGGQDGLVNTLGVVLGIAGASLDMRIVTAGGIAAAFAESISMGAVSYTSQRAERERYLALLESEKNSIKKNPVKEMEDVKNIYKEKGFKGKELDRIVNLVTSNRHAWVSIMMHEQLKVPPIERKQVFINSLVVFLSALTGSFIPLLPFFIFDLNFAILVSIIISASTLFLFGFYKGKLITAKPFRSAFELLVIGMSAAALGYAIGYLLR